MLSSEEKRNILLALRKHSGNGLLDCHHALEEVDYNFDKAIVVLREKYSDTTLYDMPRVTDVPYDISNVTCSSNMETLLKGATNYQESLENDCKEYCNWLQYMVDLSFDRDGLSSAKDLGGLVDDLCGLARSALRRESCPVNCNNAYRKEDDHDEV